MRYIPGNHDAFLRKSAGASFVGVGIEEQAIHESTDGRRYLVLHGDHFGLVATYTPCLARLGDAAYRTAFAAIYRSTVHGACAGCRTGRCRPGPNRRSKAR